MTSPTLLRRLDDRVLGSGTSRSSDGLRSAAGVVVRVSQLVLLALAAVLALAVVFVLAPVNEGNTIVAWVLAAADQVAGPLRDVFSIASRPLRALANYGLAAVVYAVASSLVGRLRPAPVRRPV